MFRIVSFWSKARNANRHRGCGVQVSFDARPGEDQRRLAAAADREHAGGEHDGNARDCGSQGSRLVVWQDPSGLRGHNETPLAIAKSVTTTVRGLTTTDMAAVLFPM